MVAGTLSTPSEAAATTTITSTATGLIRPTRRPSEQTSCSANPIQVRRTEIPPKHRIDLSTTTGRRGIESVQQKNRAKVRFSHETASHKLHLSATTRCTESIILLSDPFLKNRKITRVQFSGLRMLRRGCLSRSTASDVEPTLSLRSQRRRRRDTGNRYRKTIRLKSFVRRLVRLPEYIFVDQKGLTFLLARPWSSSEKEESLTCQITSPFNHMMGCFCKAILFNFIFQNSPAYC